MPRIARLYIRNCLLGFLLAAIFVAALIGLNVGNLRHLVTHVSGGGLAVFMLWRFNGIVFAGAQSAIAIMRIGSEPGTPGKPRRPMPAREWVPVRVRSDAGKM